jgi:chromosomal replication initiation ATPase DnaA
MSNLVIYIKQKNGWDITEKARYSGLIEARNEFFYLARKQRFTLQEIGNFLDMHHATVIHGIKKHKKKLKQ